MPSQRGPIKHNAHRGRRRFGAHVAFHGRVDEPEMGQLLREVPHVGEYRQMLAVPAPKLTWAEMFAEMAANDPEFQAWREAETRAELFASGPRQVVEVVEDAEVA